MIIPAYRARGTIRAAVDSAFANDVSLEVVVVEDGSADPVQLEDLPEGPVRLIRRDSNGGTACARNDGILAARGTWIAFLDADDMYEPRRLDHVARSLIAHSLDGVATDTRVVDGTGSSQLIRPLPGLSGRLGVRSPVIFAALVVRRSLLVDLGLFHPQWRLAEDVDMWLRILRSGAWIGYASGPVYLYRVCTEGKSLSTKPATRLWEWSHVCVHHALRSGLPWADRATLGVHGLKWAARAGKSVVSRLRSA